MADTTTEHKDEHGEHHGFAHTMSIPMLLAVYGALVVLTVLTTEAAVMGFGFGISMAIATVKAALVAAFFMHLRYDKPLNTVFFVGSLLFLFLFLSLTIMDSANYQFEIIWQEMLPKK